MSETNTNPSHSMAEADAAKTELRDLAEKHPVIANELRRIAYVIGNLQAHANAVYLAGIDTGVAIGEQNRRDAS